MCVVCDGNRGKTYEVRGAGLSSGPGKSRVYPTLKHRSHGEKEQWEIVMDGACGIARVNGGSLEMRFRLADEKVIPLIKQLFELALE